VSAVAVARSRGSYLCARWHGDDSEQPSKSECTLDFVTSLGYLDQPKKLREIMDTRTDVYCYLYEYSQDAEKPC
jgi:hypothetical protein